MPRILKTAIAIVLASALASAQSSSDNGVVRLDPALDALVSPDAKVELVKDGFGFTEGPVWVQEGSAGHLLFTDMPGNVIWKLTPDGKASVYLSNVGYNGPEVWRWGGIQNNGRERTDPRFEEFAMIGADGLTLDRQGTADRRHLCGPLAHARREKRPAHRAGRPLRGQALRRPQ